MFSLDNYGKQKFFILHYNYLYENLCIFLLIRKPYQRASAWDSFYITVDDKPKQFPKIYFLSEYFASRTFSVYLQSCALTLGCYAYLYFNLSINIEIYPCKDGEEGETNCSLYIAGAIVFYRRFSSTPLTGQVTKTDEVQKCPKS